MADGLDPDIVQDLDDISAANENAIVQPLPENRKRPRPAPICVTAGSFILCLIVQLGSQVSGSACAEGKYAVGLCLTRWQHASAPYPDSMDWLIKLEKSRSRCQESFGYITYPIFKFAKFEPCELPPQSTAQHIMQLVRGVLASELQHDGVFDYTMAPVGQIVDRWLSGLRSAKAPRFVTFAARPYYVYRVIASPSMLHIVTLSRKITRRLLLESKYPSAWHLKGIIDNVAGTLRQKAMAAPQPTESESRLGAIVTSILPTWFSGGSKPAVSSSGRSKFGRLLRPLQRYSQIQMVSQWRLCLANVAICLVRSCERLVCAWISLQCYFFATSGRHLPKLTSTFTLIHHPRLGAWKCLQSVWIVFIEVLLHHGSGAFCH